MNKEILSFFSLSGMPFGKEIKSQDLLSLPGVENHLRSLLLLAEVKGIGVLTGKSGTGKSCLVRLLKSKLHKGMYRLFYFCHSSSGVLEFYTHLCSLLGLQPKVRRADMFRMIKDKLLSLDRVNRLHPVLVLDEAHLFSTDILQEIRLLTNFEIDSYNAVTVLFCGQESFNRKLGLSVLESIANSVVVNVNVSGVTKEEGFSYIEKRINACGCPGMLFTKSSMELILQASGGIFRIINNICNSALFKAYHTKSPTVEREHVQACIGR